MSIKIEFLPDSDILIDGVPVEYQHHGKLEDAFLQLRAEIAERDATIADLETNLASVRGCFSKASIKRGQAEAELARLRAQGPVAWMWNDMIGIPHTHISPTRPTWPDAGASSAMSVAINVRPLYAEPMPAKPHPDICPCQTQPTHYAGEMPCPLSQAAKVAE